MYNTYTNPYSVPTMSVPQANNQNGITWVQGVEGAKAYQLQPNSNTVLMDSENDGIFYIKVADNVGMCTLRTFKYEELTNTPATVDLSGYVKRDELKAEVESLVNTMLGGVANEQSVSTTKSGKTITK